MTKIGGVRYNRFTPTAPWNQSNPTLACLDTQTFSFRWFLTGKQFVDEVQGKTGEAGLRYYTFDMGLRSVCYNPGRRKLVVVIQRMISPSCIQYYFEVDIQGKIEYLFQRTLNPPPRDFIIGASNNTIYQYNGYPEVLGDLGVLRNNVQSLTYDGQVSVDRTIASPDPGAFDTRATMQCNPHSFDNGKLHALYYGIFSENRLEYNAVGYYDFDLDSVVMLYPETGQQKINGGCRFISRFDSLNGDLYAAIRGETVDTPRKSIMITTKNSFQTVQYFDTLYDSNLLNQDSIRTVYGNTVIWRDYYGNAISSPGYQEFFWGEPDRFSTLIQSGTNVVFDWYFSVGNGQPAMILRNWKNDNVTGGDGLRILGSIGNVFPKYGCPYAMDAEYYPAYKGSCISLSDSWIFYPVMQHTTSGFDSPWYNIERNDRIAMSPAPRDIL